MALLGEEWTGKIPSLAYHLLGIVSLILAKPPLVEGCHVVQWLEASWGQPSLKMVELDIDQVLIVLELLHGPVAVGCEPTLEK